MMGNHGLRNSLPNGRALILKGYQFSNFQIKIELISKIRVRNYSPSKYVRRSNNKRTTTVSEISAKDSSQQGILPSQTQSINTWNKKHDQRIDFRLNISDINHETVRTDEFKDSKLPFKRPPSLGHGLKSVLHQPVSLHSLRDSRTGIYNYSKILNDIKPEHLERQIENESEPLFITPHKDTRLLVLAKECGKKYASSTSSMTSILSQLHFLLSSNRKLNITNSSISSNFPQRGTDYSQSAHYPASVILRKVSVPNKGDIISIDSDKSLDREIILSILGHSLENFLTDNKTNKFTDSYIYSMVDKFLLRSQLDAHDDSLPNYGTFDLKTRAASAIRHDLAFIEKGKNKTNYQMNKVWGEFESLEREYYDLIRTTLLKYSLQARIGKMDGIFVAYHNISNIFGFQYLPLEELDCIIHSYLDKDFEKLVKLRKSKFMSIYGVEEYLLNYERDEQAIASAVASAEFKFSMTLLRKLLGIIEHELERTIGPDWACCKLFFKTEFESKRGSTWKKPSLTVIAIPLDKSYEDKPLHIKGLSDFEIKRKLLDIENEMSKTLAKSDGKLIGLKCQVVHDYKLNPESVVIPDFAKDNSQVLPRNLRKFVKDELRADRYSSYCKTGLETPNFFHEMDVKTWKVHAITEPITSQAEISDVYKKFTREKLDALESQSIVKLTRDHNDKKEIYDRIEKAWAQSVNGKISKKPRKATDTGEYASDFQHILRSYGNRTT